MDPAIDCATAPAGYTRASAGPDAIVFPPRASIFARRGATVVRSSLAPRGTPGNTRLLLQPSLPPSVWNTSGARTVPKMRVVTVIGTRTMPCPSSCGRPATMRTVVAVSLAAS